MPNVSSTHAWNQDRCQSFIEELSEAYPKVECTMVVADDDSWQSIYKALLSGSESEVRARQTFIPGLNAANLLEHLKQLTLDDNPDVYLNWHDCTYMVKMKYIDFVRCDQIMDYCWYDLADDLDVIFPDKLIYSVCHHNNVWFIDLKAQDN